MAIKRGNKQGGNKRGRLLSVDMRGVDVRKILPEDDYLVKVEEVTEEVGETSGKPYLLWRLKVAEGEYEGTTLYHKTSLQPQALFNLKGTLIALGVSVPNSVLNLDLDKMEGLEMGVSVEKGTHDGKPKNEIVEVFPWEATENAEDAEDVEDVEDVENVENVEDAEDAEDEDDKDVDLESMNLQELLAFAKENEIDLSDLSPKDKKKASRVRAAIKEAFEEEGEEEEPEEEEIDLDTLSLEQLITLAKDNEIDLSGLSKRDLKKPSKVRAVIAEALAD